MPLLFLPYCWAHWLFQYATLKDPIQKETIPEMQFKKKTKDEPDWAHTFQKIWPCM